MKETVIISACRTAIGKFQGSLTPFSAVDLGAFAVREAVQRAGIDPALVDEIIMGNVVSAGLGQNPARQAGLKGGLSNRVAAMTINKVCGSGLKAVALAAQAHSNRQCRNRGGGWHGIDDQLPVPAAPGPRRDADWARQSARLHDYRRPLGCLRGFPHGHDGRAGGGKIRHHPPAPGCVCGGEPSPRHRRHQERPLPGRDCAHLHQAEERRTHPVRNR